MKRPERIRILGKRFSVNYANSSLAEDLNGECDSDCQLISIRDGQPIESEQDTLIHEVIHAIDDAMGLKLKESQVRSVATGLLAVIKDNAGMISYLRRRT